MTYPSATETVRDGGLGLAIPAVLLPVVIGATSLGATDTFELYSTPQACVDARGQGPGVEAVCEILSQGGGPCALVAPSCSIAASNGDVLGTYVTPGASGSITRTPTSTGPTITPSGAPTGVYSMKVEITTAGILGTAKFKWSKNGGSSYTTGVTSGASVELGDTGLTIAMAAGTYVLGEIYSWSTTVTGGTLAVSGDSTLDAHVRVEILTAGALGVATFRYSCDDYSGSIESERTYSETLTVPSGGTFSVPGLEITLTFSGTFVAGDYYEIDVECAAPNATNLADAFDNALKTTATPWRFAELVLSRANGDSTAHAVMTAAFQSQLVALQNTSRYRAGMVAADQGEDTPATAVTAFANTVASRCLVAYGRVRRTTVNTFPGWGFPVTHGVDVFAARAVRSIPSTDLKRVLDGSLTEVVKLFHDESATPSSLDDAKISTLRTWDQRVGFYIGQARIKSGSGSDFLYWYHRVLMDMACEIAHDESINIIGRGLRTNKEDSEDGSIKKGSIDGADIAKLEQAVKARLSAVLLEQPNAEGTKGWVQQIAYQIDTQHNFDADGIVLATVGIKPFRSADFVRTTLGFMA